MVNSTVLSNLTDIPLDVRLKLLQPDKLPQQEFIFSVVSDWEKDSRLKSMKTGQKYYSVKNEVLDKKKRWYVKDGVKVEATLLTNSTLAHPFLRKLVNQKVAYCLSKPFTIKTEDKDFPTKLKKYFTKQFLRKLQRVAIDSVCCAIGWLQVYYNEQGQLDFKRIEPTEIIPFWRDADHTILDALIRVYEIKEYDGTKSQTVKKIEYYCEMGIYRYRVDAKGITLESESAEGNFNKIELVDGVETEIPMLWKKIPFIAFKYNPDEMPLISVVKTLVDDYDSNSSSTSDIIQDTPNNIKVVKDFDGEDKEEFVKNLSEFRTVFVGESGGIDSVNSEVQVNAVEAHLKRLRTDIFEFGGGIDTQTKELKDASGVALKFLYSDLDLDCSIMLNEFASSFDNLMWFIGADISIDGTKYEIPEYEIIFNTDMIVNENDTINNLAISNTMLSRETIVANHPYVQDPKVELERLAADEQTKLDALEKTAQIQKKYASTPTKPSGANSTNSSNQ